MNFSFTACALITLSSSVVSQSITTKVIPAGVAKYDANSSSVFPFGYQSQHMQQVIAGSAICTTQAAITSLKMRINLSDAATAGPFQTQMTVTLGHTSQSPATMSSTFNSNITGPTTQIFNGNINTPAQTGLPPGSKAAPFNITLATPLAPFIYDLVKGDLLVDIQTGLPSGKSSYFVDAATTGGSYRSFGTPGTLANRERLQIQPTGQTQQAVPGGALEFTTISGSQSYTGEVMIGLDDSMLAGIPLPIDLSSFGATGNTLYIASIASAPHKFVFGGSRRYESVISLPIPSSPQLVGGQIFAQPYVLNTAANAAGVVFGDAAEGRIGSNTALPYSQIGHYDISAAAGKLFRGQTQTGGAVIQFSGIFQ